MDFLNYLHTTLSWSTEKCEKCCIDKLEDIRKIIGISKENQKFAAKSIIDGVRNIMLNSKKLWESTKNWSFPGANQITGESISLSIISYIFSKDTRKWWGNLNAILRESAP